MRTLRSRLTILVLGVVVCHSGSLLAAPIVLCTPRTETTTASADVDCPCGDETGTCPMHHKGTKSNRPAPSAPAKGKAYCSGCADNADAALLAMTGLAAPIVTPFDLVAPQSVIGFVAAPSRPFVPVDPSPSAPPPKA